MKYTVRFAHLQDRPMFSVGDKINYGRIIGKVGNSGQSTARHLHIDLAEGFQREKFLLAAYEKKSPPPGDIRQLLYFIDAALFGGVPPVITTPYAEVEYFEKRGKVHFGFDLVPKDRFEPMAKMEIHWNRSMPGEVLAILDDPEGYGNCLYVGFEA